MEAQIHGEWLVMQYPTMKDIPYEEIENGALILLLLVRECKSWEELCSRYAYADPKNPGNTNTKRHGCLHSFT